MKDSNGNDFDPCPGETRKGPGALRHEAHRLRAKADLLDMLADQTDGTLSEDADMMLYALMANDQAQEPQGNRNIIMRRNAARFIEKQLEWKTKESRECHFPHYGVMEIREMLDYIYGGEPNNEDEEIKSKGGVGGGMGFTD